MWLRVFFSFLLIGAFWDNLQVASVCKSFQTIHGLLSTIVAPHIICVSTHVVQMGLAFFIYFQLSSVQASIMCHPQLICL